MKTKIMLWAIVLLLSGLTDSVYGWNEGPSDTLFGLQAGNSLSGGEYNTFIGTGAGWSTTTGNYNTFLGYFAGHDNIIGQHNTFLGYYAGYSDNTGYDNVFLGSNAGTNNTNGYRNIFLGNSAGYTNTTGYRNNFQGQQAGYSNSAGNRNVFIGFQAGYYETGSNKLYIDNSATSTPLIYGEFDNDILSINGNVGIGTMTPAYPLETASGAYVTAGGVWTDASSRRYKDDIRVLSREEAFETLSGLNPVKFVYKADRTEQHVGFIAEDVPELVSTKDRNGLSSMDIVTVLTKVVQEQQKIVEQQQEIISSHSKEIAELKRLLTSKAD